jgi:hypothetical protein
MDLQSLSNRSNEELKAVLDISTPIMSLKDSLGWIKLREVIEAEINSKTPYSDRIAEGQVQEVVTLVTYVSALKWLLETVDTQEKIVNSVSRELESR